MDQGVFLSSSNSYYNNFSNSITEEHIGDQNYLKCYNILIEPVRDIDLQDEAKTLNLHPQIPYSQERLDAYHKIVCASLDDHIMFESV